jgi:hypothetical protein
MSVAAPVARPGALGFSVQPAKRTRRLPGSMKNSTYSRCQPARALLPEAMSAPSSRSAYRADTLGSVLPFPSSTIGANVWEVSAPILPSPGNRASRALQVPSVP